MRFLAAFFLFAGAPAAWSQEGPEIVGARERAWLASLNGNVRADGLLEGTNFSVDEIFDFDRVRFFNDLSAWVNVPLLVIDRVNAGYWFGEFKDTSTLTETIQFGDQTFTASSDVTATLEFDVFTATIEKFIFAPGEDNLGVALGIQAGIKYFDIEAGLASDTFGFDELREVKGPLPILGARFIGQFTEWFRVEAEFSGIGGQYGDVRGYYVEGVAEVAFQPVKYIMLGIGYKFAILNIEDTGDTASEVDFRLGGVFFMVGVKF